MIGFWFIVSLLVLGTLFVLIRVLYTAPAANDETESIDDVTIYEQRLTELEADLAAGLITAQEAENSRKEIQLALLNQQQTETKAEQKAFPVKKTAFIISGLVPVLVLSMYFYLGRPDLIGNLQRQSDENTPVTLEQIEQMINGLEERLKEEPDNANGWSMLYRSYVVLERYDKAVIAAENLYRIMGDDPNILLGYADALAMSNNNTLSGKPAELIQRALEIEPENPSGLWLAGMAASEQGEFQTALDHWEKLLPQLKDDPEPQQQLTQMIQATRARLGLSPAESASSSENVAMPPAKLVINVSLNPKLENEVNPEDTLFVYAKGLSGPPIPLAIVRKTANDLPLQVTLDDSTAIMSSNTLSDHQQVQVIARISRTGNGIPEQGDLIGSLENIMSRTKEVIQITIDKKVP